MTILTNQVLSGVFLSYFQWRIRYCA